MKNLNTKRRIEQIWVCLFLVGVKFIFSEEGITFGIAKLNGHRYCQALMKARHGDKVILDAEGLACPAAAAAFGFKPLPESLKSGKGLVGFGITSNEETGKTMFEEWSPAQVN
jgi:uncharacterized protein (DUF169 family)